MAANLDRAYDLIKDMPLQEALRQINAAPSDILSKAEKLRLIDMLEEGQAPETTFAGFGGGGPGVPTGATAGYPSPIVTGLKQVGTGFWRSLLGLKPTGEPGIPALAPRLAMPTGIPPYDLTTAEEIGRQYGKMTRLGVAKAALPIGGWALSEFAEEGPLKERLRDMAIAAGAEAGLYGVTKGVPLITEAIRGKLAARVPKAAEYHARVASGLRTGDPWATAEFQSLQTELGQDRANQLLRRAVAKYPGVMQAGRGVPARYNPEFAAMQAKISAIKHTVEPAGKLTVPPPPKPPTTAFGQLAMEPIVKPTFKPDALSGLFAPESIEYIKVMLSGWPDAPVDELVKGAQAIHGRRKGLVGIPDIEASLAKLGYDPNAGRRMATAKQKAYIHMLAREKGLTDVEYKRLAKEFIGTITTKEATEEQASWFIDVLKGIEPKYRGPTLSRLTTLVDEDFNKLVTEKATKAKQGIKIGPLRLGTDFPIWDEHLDVSQVFAPAYNVLKPAYVQWLKANDESKAAIMEMLDGTVPSRIKSSDVVAYVGGKKTIDDLKGDTKATAIYTKAVVEGKDPYIEVTKHIPPDELPDDLRIFHAVNTRNPEILEGTPLKKHYGPVVALFDDYAKTLVERGDLKPKQLIDQYAHHVIYNMVVEGLYKEGGLPEIFPSMPTPEAGPLKPREGSPFFIPSIWRSTLYYSYALNKHLHYRPADQVARFMVKLISPDLPETAKAVDAMREYLLGRPSSLDKRLQATFPQLGPFAYAKVLSTVKGGFYDLTLIGTVDMTIKNALQWTQYAALYGPHYAMQGYLAQFTPEGKKILKEVEEKLMAEAPGVRRGLRADIRLEQKPAIFDPLSNSPLLRYSRVPLNIVRTVTYAPWGFFDKINRQGALSGYYWAHDRGASHKEATEEIFKASHIAEYGYTKADSPISYATHPWTRAIAFAKWPAHHAQFLRYAASKKEHRLHLLQWAMMWAAIIVWGRRHKLNLAGPVSSMWNLMKYGISFPFASIGGNLAKMARGGPEGALAESRLKMQVNVGFTRAGYKYKNFYDAYMNEWYHYESAARKKLKGLSREEREMMRVRGKVRPSYGVGPGYEGLKFAGLALKPPQRSKLLRHAAAAYKRGDLDKVESIRQKMQDWGMPVGTATEWIKTVRIYGKRYLKEE